MEVGGGRQRFETAPRGVAQAPEDNGRTSNAGRRERSRTPGRARDTEVAENPPPKDART